MTTRSAARIASGRTVTAALAAIATTITTFGAGCAHGTHVTAVATAGGADVVARLDANGGLGTLDVTIDPVEDGFHIYSVDLEPTAIGALGVATSVRVEGGWRTVGETEIDREVVLLEYPALDIELPVYPDGPVSLTLPIERVSGEPADVWITYATCSSSRCNRPVRDMHLVLAPG